jgi:oligoribonuclease
METRLLFLDVETSHLDPLRGRVLELAAILTDADLLELGRWSWLFARPPLADMLDTVDMHRTSGLLSELVEGSGAMYSTQRDRAEHQLLTTLVERGLAQRSLQLAGYSIAFDRAWLRVHMPTLDGWLSHRMIDVSTVRELSKRWAPTLAPDATQAHRSMRDCEAACAELHSYRSRLWEGRS